MKKIITNPLSIFTILFLLIITGFFLYRQMNSQYLYTSLTSVPKSQNDNSHMIDGKLNINAATAEELSLLPGIGDALADRIVSYREKAGGFTSTLELLNIKGIGNKQYEIIKDYITAGGS